jgi:hypothetical protein
MAMEAQARLSLRNRITWAMSITQMPKLVARSPARRGARRSASGCNAVPCRAASWLMASWLMAPRRAAGYEDGIHTSGSNSPTTIASSAAGKAASGLVVSQPRPASARRSPPVSAPVQPTVRGLDQYLTPIAR